MSSMKPKNHLGIVKCAFENVVDTYLEFLENNAYVVNKKLTNDVKKEKTILALF